MSSPSTEPNVDRDARHHILKLLATRGSMTLPSIAAAIASNDDELRSHLAGLVGSGVVSRNSRTHAGATYKIAAASPDANADAIVRLLAHHGESPLADVDEYHPGGVHRPVLLRQLGDLVESGEVVYRDREFRDVDGDLHVVTLFRLKTPIVPLGGDVDVDVVRRGGPVTR